jgi:hypothetical protein
VRSFGVIMLVGVLLSTAAAILLVRTVLPPAVWESPGPTDAPIRRAGAAADQPAVSGGEAVEPLGQREAVELVAARLGPTPKAERMRQTLRSAATVQYQSPNHWTVRLNEASWTAHGPGRYAEPDNEAARLYEDEARGP